MKRKLGVTFSPLSEEVMNTIRETAKGFDVIFTDNQQDERLLECEVIFGMVNNDIVHNSKALKWLHTQYAGVDYYLQAEKPFPTDVMLTNSSGAYGIGISEYLLMTTLMLMWDMNGYMKQQFARKWEGRTQAKTLFGSKVTVIGLGDIGSHYAKRCKALGATVTGVVRTKREIMPAYVDALYTTEQMGEAIKDADAVALCLPGTAETVRIFDREKLSQLKQGALLLNVGRGTAIDQDVLIEKLQSGAIGGAALDVTDPEPLPEESPLWELPNVVITPHISGKDSVPLTLQLIVERFARYFADYVAGKPFEQVVNKGLGY